ncbi:MAG: MFS transporter [Bergeyella sp.]
MLFPKNSQKFFPLQLSFIIFSMVLNCMGIIVLKYSGSDISYNHLGFLEFFKDIPIALTSLLAINYINKTGNKKSLIFAISTVLVCCILIPFVDDFWFFKIWFALIGISFAIAKISVFGLIRNNAGGEKGFSKVMNRVEASFMIGMFFINIIFGWLLSGSLEQYWKFGFWIIALVSAITILQLYRNHYTELQSENISYSMNLKAIFNFRTMLFLLILFFTVFTEQCFNTWLPAFYKNNLHVNSFFALQSTALLAFFSFVGRFATSRIIHRFKWQQYILFCIFMLILCIVLAQLLMNISVKQNLYTLMLLLPFLGLFLSPLYPLYNSKFLINISSEKINILTSMIVIFSSLGGSFGSLGMSYVFEHDLDKNFLLFILIPVFTVFAVTVIFLKTLILRQ